MRERALTGAHSRDRHVTGQTEDSRQTDVHHETGPAEADGAPGDGGDGGPAAAGRHGAGADGAGQDPGAAGAAHRVRVHPERRGDGLLDAGRSGGGVPVLANAAVARAAPRSGGRAEQPRPRERRVGERRGRRARPQLGRVPDGRAGEEDRRRGGPRRDHRRPAHRAGDRSGHAAVLPRAGARLGRVRRRLRRGDTPARTSTRSPGALPRSRCPWR